MPFELVLGLSHHKSGTSQLGCIMWNAAKGAGVPAHVYQVCVGWPPKLWEEAARTSPLPDLASRAVAGGRRCAHQVPAPIALPRLAQNDGVKIENITNFLADLGERPHRPALFLTSHILWSQVCYTKSPAGALVQCPWRAPCKCTDDACTAFRNTLEIGNCVFHLPALDVALVHAVRNPIDVVVSAYLYHSQDPPPEGWINLEVRQGGS